MSHAPDDLTSRLRSGLDRGPAPDLSDDIVAGAAGRRRPRLVDPNRTLRVAGGATLAIAAVTVGALVAVPALTRPAPLFTAATAEQSGSPMAADDAATQDMKIGWWMQYVYSADPTLSTQGARGTVYRLALDAGDPQARTAELAAALGVDGDVVKADYYDAAYPTWAVGPQDGTGANLTYGGYGTGDWWFSDAAGASFVVCDASVTAEQSTEYGCTLPEDAPENLAPNAAEARADAAELFAATGFDVEPAAIDVATDDWGTSATAYLVLEGQRTALSWNAYWSNNGILAYAYGHSVRVEERGVYDTVSPTAAVERLADGRWWGAAGPDFEGGAVLFAADLAREGAAPAIEDGTAETDPVDGTDGSGTDPAAPDEPGTGEPGTGEPSEGEPSEGVPGEGEPGEEPGEEPAPVESEVPEPVESEAPVDPAPEPTPEVIEVVVDNATPTLLLLWDVDGNAWLVPGYAMETPDGWWNAVVSLIDGVITLPEPVEIDPAVLREGATY
jgi:hypothetical protein